MIYAVTILGGDERFLGTHIEGYERLKQQECSQEQPKGVEEKEARLERTSKEEKGDENKQTNKQKEARINRLTHQALRVNRKKKKEGEEEREKERERDRGEDSCSHPGINTQGRKRLESLPGAVSAVPSTQCRNGGVVVSSRRLSRA